jgi:hypothetical protein
MSAAEPATPEHPPTPIREEATVIRLDKRRPHRGTHAHAGRWNPMHTPPGDTPDPGRARTPLELVIEDMEKWLNAVDHTLADEDTVAVVKRTLQMVDHIVLAGAEARGIITGAQRADLAELVAGLVQAAEAAESA